MPTKYTQRADGRWSTRIWDGSYVKGKKHYTTLYSTKSSKDLEKKVIDFETKRMIGGITVKSDTDVWAYSKKWLQTQKALRAGNTKTMYNNIIEVHLKDFEGCSWDSFTLSSIQGLFNERADKARTCQQMQLTLKQIGRAAEFDKLLPKGTTDDIFRHVVIPKYKAKEKTVLTDIDKSALQNAKFTPKERAFVFTLYFTGIRREEALALKKSDISEVLTINKAVAFDKNNPYIKITKSERGNRSVPVPAALSPILKEYMQEVKGDDLFFMTKSMYRRFWESIQKKITAAGGNGDITAHTFRHNYCTRLCYTSITEHSITTKKIAELLGDTEKMVLEVYSHILNDLEKTEQSIDSALKL